MSDSAMDDTTAPPSPWIARGDEDRLAGGEPAHQRGRGEQRDSGEEEAALAVEVAEAAAEQQEAAERERVGVDDPRQVVLVEVERVADRGEGDVDDGGVQNDHELGCRQQGQR